jgi:hypothetical protein
LQAAIAEARGEVLDLTAGFLHGALDRLWAQLAAILTGQQGLVPTVGGNLD